MFYVKQMYTSLESLIGNIPVRDSEATDFPEAMRELVESGADIVRYSVNRSFLVNNIKAFEIVADNKVKFEVNLHGDGDVITDVRSDVPIIVKVGQLVASPDDQLISTAAQYSAIKVTFYLDPEHFPETFTLSYKVLLLEQGLRSIVSTTPGISGGSIAYYNGMGVRVQ